MSINELAHSVERLRAAMQSDAFNNAPIEILREASERLSAVRRKFEEVTNK